MATTRKVPTKRATPRKVAPSVSTNADAELHPLAAEGRGYLTWDDPANYKTENVAEENPSTDSEGVYRRTVGTVTYLYADPGLWPLVERIEGGEAFLSTGHVVAVSALPKPTGTEYVSKDSGEHRTEHGALAARLMSVDPAAELPATKRERSELVNYYGLETLVGALIERGIPALFATAAAVEHVVEIGDAAETTESKPLLSFMRRLAALYALEGK